MDHVIFTECTEVHRRVRQIGFSLEQPSQDKESRMQREIWSSKELLREMIELLWDKSQNKNVSGIIFRTFKSTVDLSIFLLLLIIDVGTVQLWLSRDAFAKN